MKRSDVRSDIRKKKRNRTIGVVFILFAIVIGLAVYYWYDQYQKGLDSANDSAFSKDENGEETIFEGAEPEFGEINVLLLGSDARKDEDGRSDTLMIAHYNQDDKSAKLISLMRDLYVEVPGHGMQKLNSAFTFGGPELVRQTIKENFGLDIHYYAMVDFKGFPKIVDIIAPDGIEVDIPYTMEHGIYMTLKPGKQILHGEQLLGYVRFRHDYKNDFGRVERQQEVIGKLKDEAVSVHSILSLPKLLGTVDGYMETNLDKMTILSIGKGIMDNKDEKISTLRIPVDGSFTDPMTDVGRVLDFDLEENKEAINKFLDGTLEVAETDDQSSLN